MKESLFKKLVPSVSSFFSFQVRILTNFPPRIHISLFPGRVASIYLMFLLLLSSPFFYLLSFISKGLSFKVLCYMSISLSLLSTFHLLFSITIHWLFLFTILFQIWVYFSGKYCIIIKWVSLSFLNGQLFFCFFRNTFYLIITLSFIYQPHCYCHRAPHPCPVRLSLSSLPFLIIVGGDIYRDLGRLFSFILLFHFISPPLHSQICS